jgi:hypothetical protein
MKREQRFFFFLLLILFNVILLGFRAEASSYTVKAGGGGNYTSISACAAAAVAGDSCTVYAGSYGGWTQPTSGSAGKTITFTANSGDTVTITSNVDISSRSYININHFTFSNAGIIGNGTTSHNIIDSNKGNSTLFRINDGQGSNGSDNVISNNTLVFTSRTTNAEGFYVYGDRNRFENNDVSGGGGDFLDWGGKNVVVRNNKFHDINGSISGEHLDFFQVIGGGTIPTGTFSLFEGNVEYNCLNDGGNCHNVIIRTGGAGGTAGADTIIVRYNYSHDNDGSGASFGGIGDNVPNSAFYNNTYANLSIGGGSAICASYQNAPASLAANNICYNVGTTGSFQIGGCNFSGLTGRCNGDLLFDTGYTGGWDTVYSGEATYAALHNQNPLFANYPTDDSLQSGSPAKGAGVALTTAVGSGSSSTSLTVVNAHGFQPGWAGVNADWIQIGASTTVQIAAINYSTNVLTLASPVSWGSGASVNLYKKSDGAVVLDGANPDIGAYYPQSNLAPPVNLQATVK